MSRNNKSATRGIFADAGKAKEDMQVNRAIPELVKQLQTGDEYTRKRTVRELQKIGEPAILPLINILNDDTATFKHHIVEALGKISLKLGDSRPVETLIDLINDGDQEVRRQVVIALGNLNDSRAVEPLINALGDGAWQVKNGARWSLFQLGEHSVLPLVDALIQKNQEIDALTRKNQDGVTDTVTGSIPEKTEKEAKFPFNVVKKLKEKYRRN
ncbi:MAG: HEAT repeat domain-containing protein [Candidatus Odinarchaeota archaeon]